MKKFFYFSVIFIIVGLMLRPSPFFSVALSAPSEVTFELVKSDSPDPVIAGQQLIYTLTVTNTGDEPATGVLITDTLPAGVTFVVASPGCNQTAGIVECNLGSLAQNVSEERQITVQVDTSATGILTNTAEASSNETTSPVTASATTTINTSADLVITKSDGVTEVTAGEATTRSYTIEVTNTGPSDASDVLVTDTWPAGFSRGTVTHSAGGACDTTTSTTDFTCTFTNIPAGGGATITANYTVPANTPDGPQTNTVLAESVDASAPATASDVNTVLNSASLGISKSDGVTQVTAGSSTVRSYTIQVTNAGPSNASGVLVTDTWPAGFTRGAVNPTAGGACDTTTSTTNFTCTFTSIPAGGGATISANYTVPANTPEGVKTNTVQADSEDAVAPVTASDATTVVTGADLSLTKLDDPDPVHSGEIVTYTLSVTNLGPSDASEVVLTDNLPAEAEYDAGLSSPECSSTVTDVVTCDLGTIIPGSLNKKEVVIKARVTRMTAGQVTNQASVSSDTFDPNPANNTDSTATTVDVGNPVVTSWDEPVAFDKYFDVVCQPVCQSVRLKVSATDDVGVARVQFRRWDHVHIEWVEIGNVFTAPYQLDLDTRPLPIGYNQIYARAYDSLGHVSTGKRIFLVKWDVYLPVVER